MASFVPVGVIATVEGLSTFSRDMNKINSKIGSVAKTAAKAAIGGIAAIGAGITAIGAASLKSAISFESAFAGVIKTTDGLTDEFGDLTEMGEEMRQGFRDLSKEIPTTVEELTAIGEIGGQLGIASDDLLDFTEVISAMGVATNLTTEEAAVQFAQLANIMGTVEREGSDAFSKFGSSIVALGNNFATTEADISSFASRIAGAGSIAGLAESDVLAIGAAMSSVGVQAEAGGTAVQKVLFNINEAVLTGSEDLETFAATAGLSATEFADLWEKDAAEALTLFIEGLGDAGDEAIFILEDLGMTDQRLTRSFLSLAGAGDLLRDTVELSSEAWEENTALTKEADQRYATTESQIKLVKNTINDLAISVGDVLLPFFNKLLKGFNEFITKQGPKIEIILGTIVDIIDAFISGAPGDFPWEDIFPPKLADTMYIISDVFEALGDIIDTFLSGAPGDFPWEDILPPDLANVMYTISNAFEIIRNTILNLVNVISTFVTEHAEGLKAALIAIGVVLAGAAIVSGVISLATAIAAIVNPITLIIGAIALLAAAWTEDWGGIRTTITTWWEETGKPIFEALQLWLATNIPVAIESLKMFWEGTLLPALTTVWGYITETLIPAFENVWAWLEEKIPEAIETAKTYWEDTLKPALETIWGYITENVIPAIESIATWLGEKIPQAITVLQIIWTEVLMPAFQGLWSFIQDNLMVILAALSVYVLTQVVPMLIGFATTILTTVIPAIVSWAAATLLPMLPIIALGAAIVALGLIWNEYGETVKTTLEQIKFIIFFYLNLAATKLQTFIDEGIEGWKSAWEDLKIAVGIIWDEIKTFITEGIEGWKSAWDDFKLILETIGTILSDTLTKAWDDLMAKFDTAKATILEPVKKAFESIKTAIENIKNTIGGLADKLKNIDLGPFTPGSPTPFEIGLRGIGDALEDLSISKIPEFQNALRSMGKIGETASGLLVGEIAEIDGEVAQVNEKIEGLWAILERMESGELPDVLKLDLIRDINAQEAERNRLLGERLQAEEKIAMLQRQQQQIEFLQQQTELLDIIRQNQLNAAEILGGLELGIEASATDVADAMIRAMQAMVARTQEELGIASPSSVFARIGEQIAEGLAMGIQRGGGAVSQIAAQTMSASPTSSTAVNNTFNTTINSGMDQAFFEQQVLQTVSGALP